MERKNYWTSKRKVEVVLLLLRGEEIDILSRKYEVTVADISQWRDVFLVNGANGFKRSPEDFKLHKAERLIGRLQMELELIKKKKRVDAKAKRELLDALSREVCSFTQKPYPMRLNLKVVGYSSSAWYVLTTSGVKQRQGPRPAIEDDRALVLIKDAIGSSPFHSEGYQKVSRKLAKKGHCVAKERVNRLMRENGLLSAIRPVRGGWKNMHEGKITADGPNVMWATDSKKFFAGADG